MNGGRPARVLVAEDDTEISGPLVRALQREGYEVALVSDGPTALAGGMSGTADLLVLDLGLPGMDGLTVLRGWRDAGHSMPVLVLTARGTWHEKVLGIDSGADDYLSKPFQIEEVLARLRALIRRASGHATPELHCGAIRLDPRTARVLAGGVPVRVTGHEFRVLSYLMHHQGRLVSQAELTEHIYAQGADRDSNTVEVFVARLRRKLGAGAIDTVRGLGYRMTGGAP